MDRAAESVRILKIILFQNTSLEIIEVEAQPEWFPRGASSPSCEANQVNKEGEAQAVIVTEKGNRFCVSIEALP